MLSLTQQQGLGMVLYNALREIGAAAFAGESARSAALAEAVAGLPVQMLEPDFAWSDLERKLQVFQDAYPRLSTGPAVDYLGMLPGIRDAAPDAARLGPGLLSESERRGFLQLLDLALGEMRELARAGMSEQLARLAFSVDNLPAVIYRPHFSWLSVDSYLRRYQREYPQHAYDYVAHATQLKFGETLPAAKPLPGGSPAPATRPDFGSPAAVRRYVEEQLAAVLRLPWAFTATSRTGDALAWYIYDTAFTVNYARDGEPLNDLPEYGRYYMLTYDPPHNLFTVYHSRVEPASAPPPHQLTLQHVLKPAILFHGGALEPHLPLGAVISSIMQQHPPMESWCTV